VGTPLGTPLTPGNPRKPTRPSAVPAVQWSAEEALPWPRERAPQSQQGGAGRRSRSPPERNETASVGLAAPLFRARQCGSWRSVRIPGEPGQGLRREVGHPSGVKARVVSLRWSSPRRDLRYFALANSQAEKAAASVGELLGGTLQRTVY
jgi:hypothetical protein